ncbi:MAG: hypothetical protein ACLSWY_00520 [Ruthenibacterium lactatiformans]
MKRSARRWSRHRRASIRRGNALESLVGVRTRQIQRKLRSVTTLPEGAAGEALEE